MLGVLVSIYLLRRYRGDGSARTADPGIVPSAWRFGPLDQVMQAFARRSVYTRPSIAGLGTSGHTDLRKIPRGNA